MRNVLQQFVDCSCEVSAALAQKKPVLALESTLITHGLPYPHNIETALMVEEICRNDDVVPATIAIIAGKIKIGLQQEELTTLVQDQHVAKASTRDLPYILSQKLNAGTTVAATLFCASLAKIKIFATGGMGGVHRGSAQDISADLIELSRTSIAMVCAGVKAILDIPKTLELLETLSIPVIAFNTPSFPAFYTRESQHLLPLRVNAIEDLTTLIDIHWKIGVPSGILIANPIPKEDEIPATVIEPAITDALILAQQKQIQGKAITPFLLSHIADLTQGKSLSANIKLIANNVKLAARVAKSLYKH